jgi:hypothetical protein
MSEPLKLLNEDCISEQKTITENVGNSQHMYITGPFLQAVTRNRNGRVYPQHIIEREVNKFQSLIESREAVGELSHPDSGEINPDRAAILITDLHMDGNLGMGKAKVLSTPCGKILESLLNDGVRMGVSSRGTGNLGKDNVVCEDFSLLTIDAVYMPSAQVAYSDAIYESIQSTVKWVLDEKSGLLIEKKEDINKAAEKFNKTVDKEGSKAIVDAFKEFLSRL